MKPEELTSEQKHAIIVAAAEDKKANYVTSIDLTGKTLIADYFVICSGTSNIHIRAIADGIMEAMEKHGHRREMLEGYSEASWILLSYGDVIAHIMGETQRSYYGLEKLWDANAETPVPSEPAHEDDTFDVDDEVDEGDIEEIHDDFGEAEIDEEPIQQPYAEPETETETL
ncbi:MAG: ribosome silencing factor [Capsulimonadaceae bacterium]|nr:ribosome silencing factor [Capsulimonadaceae bacterium]